MSDQPTLQIEPRTGTGSSSARQMRRHGRIPGILFGHGEPQNISLDAITFTHVVPPAHYGSAVVQLKQGDESLGTALVKAVQTNTLKKQVLHVDLLRVSAEDRISVAVAVVLQGEPAATRAGGVLDQNVHNINLRCRASDVPAQIEYDVSPLQIGDAVHAAQLALPPGCELLDKPDEAIAVILAPTVPALEEPVEVEPIAGPDLTGAKQKEDFPSER